MLEFVTPNESDNQNFTLSLDEIARQGAKKLLAEALQREVADSIDRNKDERNEQGKAQVVRNGAGRPRKVTLAQGQSKFRLRELTIDAIAKDSPQASFLPI